MLGLIYKITNNINGKIYIGQTKKSLKERFQKHCWKATEKDTYHSDMAIKKAIRKYGKNNFSSEILEYTEYTNLDSREKYWIACYNSYYNGYNCTKGGQNGATRKCKLSKEDEEKLIQMKLSGSSSAELGLLYNVDKSTVKNIFKRHGLTLPIRRNLEERITLKDFLSFLNNHPTEKEIQEKFGISRSSVRNYIKRHNIDYNLSKSVQTLTDNAEG